MLLKFSCMVPGPGQNSKLGLLAYSLRMVIRPYHILNLRTAAAKRSLLWKYSIMIICNSVKFSVENFCFSVANNLQHKWQQIKTCVTFGPRNKEFKPANS